MYKASMDLGAIGGVKVRFDVVVNNHDPYTTVPEIKIVNKFKFDSSKEFIRFAQRPYLVFDIARKKDQYDPDHTVTLNRISFYQFRRFLRSFMAIYKEVKDLFYYDGNVLVCDPAMTNKYVREFRTQSRKTIILAPTVVNDTFAPEPTMYEGCYFAINRTDNFAYITYGELEILMELLQEINFTELGFMLLHTAISAQNIPFEEVEGVHFTTPQINDKPAVVTMPEESSTFTEVRPPDVIPKI